MAKTMKWVVWLAWPILAPVILIMVAVVLAGAWVAIPFMSATFKDGKLKLGSA